MAEVKICPTCGTEYPLSERFCPRDGSALRGSNPQGDLVGSVVHDKFHVMKKLGEGGMGAVYLAEHVKMGKKMALKVMNPGMHQDADAIARFNREAKNASQINHPNVCAIYDFGETADGMIYLAMEFIEGSSLSGLIEKAGSLAPARAASIIHQAADALQVAHDYGIVHRDLKPDNIMIAKARDGSDHVKVVDFGIAKASSSDAQKVTKTGLVVGTPEYMSPEQLAGDKLDGRSDIYSLGLVAFNCLTGKLPFPSNSAQEAMIMRLTDHPKSLAEMRPDISWPDDLQAVMSKALARDAAERYQSAAEFGRDIHRATENMPATIAAEAGTQVIGAGAAVAAAAAKTAAIPQTRVAGAGERGGAAVPPAAAPVAQAPVKKSGMPMMAIAGIATVVIGGAGWFVATQMGKGGNGATGETTGTQAPVIAPPVSGTSTQSQAAGNTQGSAGRAPIGNQAAGIRQLSAPGPETPKPNATPTVDYVAEIDRWEKILGDTAATKARAREAVSVLEAVIDNTSGTVRASAYYVQSMAYAVMEDEQRACSAARTALASGAQGSHRRSAQSFVDVACK